MTDDLVTRLRNSTAAMASNASVDMYLWDRHSNACLKAADRIEQLEAALLEIFDHECRTKLSSFIACTARDALWPRAALEGKDD